MNHNTLLPLRSSAIILFISCSPPVALGAWLRKPVLSNQALIFSPSACDLDSYFTEQMEVIWRELPQPSTSCCLPKKSSLLHLNIFFVISYLFFPPSVLGKKQNFPFSPQHVTRTFDRIPLPVSETPISLFHLLHPSFLLVGFLPSN